MSNGKLKIAFLIGRDDPTQQMLIAKVCELHGVETVAVLLDTGVAGRKDRWRNLKRNIRREGLSYVFYRAVSAIKDRLDALAARVIPQKEVGDLLRAAFPERGLDRLAESYGFKVYEAGNLNQSAAIERLKSVDADLGILLGTRVLKRSLFSVPRMGCINLHKGRVPNYRGQPPGFWELYEGERSAGVTVHFVDDGLDTGDIVGRSEVAIHPMETPESLRTKLDLEGTRLLVSVMEQFLQGSVVREPQPSSTAIARTRPTRIQQNELARRLPHWRRLGAGPEAMKTALWLLLYYTGVFALLRWSRRGKSRGAILLYHRVNDISQDVLTCSTRRFAEHLVALRHFYRPMSTQQMIEQLANHAAIEPTGVAVHFDDCYRDVRTCAAPLLTAAKIPGTSFVSSGFVDTERVFAHDQKKYPHRFENFKVSDLRELPGLGVEVAAHTVNHVDLGTIALEQARAEVVGSRSELEQLTGRPVLLFSFPFGGIQHIREEVREMVVAAGYRALFSAHGGFVTEKTSQFDIPRIGVCADHSPLALLMILEGISPQDLRIWFKSFGKSAKPIH